MEDLSRTQASQMEAAILEGIEISRHAILEWIAENLEPQQVFEDEQLEAWANNNGYIKQEEKEDA